MSESCYKVLHEMLLSLIFCNVRSQLIFLFPLFQGSHQVEARISHVTSTGTIFLQIPGAGLNRLEELMTDITEHYNSKVSNNKKSKEKFFMVTVLHSKI